MVTPFFGLAAVYGIGSATFTAAVTRGMCAVFERIFQTVGGGSLFGFTAVFGIGFATPVAAAIFNIYSATLAATVAKEVAHQEESCSPQRSCLLQGRLLTAR